MRKIHFKLLLNPIHITGDLLKRKTIRDILEESGAKQNPDIFSVDEDESIDNKNTIAHFDIIKRIFLSFKEFLQIKFLKSSK